MKKAILTFALIFPTCCAATPFHPRIHTLATFAVQCVPVREVVCVIDEDMSKESCRNVVVPAILHINKATRRNILHFGGLVTTREDAIKAIESGTIAVMGDSLPDRLLGSTLPHQNGTCIDKVIISLHKSAVLGPAPIVNPVQVATHELLHAIGFDHASTNSNLKSIMAPAANSQTFSPVLTEGDINSLRAVYGISSIGG